MTEALLQVGLGAAGSLLAAGAIRLGTGILDFVPRRLDAISIGSSFESFCARGPGDNYDDVLSIRIRNQGPGTLFIVRCVYFRDRKHRVPLYLDARPSQKYHSGFEVKFGPQWKEQSALLESHEEADSYIPLKESADSADILQGQRGKLFVEYVYDGRTGLHRARL